MVFLASFSEISLASEEMSVMNSTQHSIKRSRASFENDTPDCEGNISDTIFWTVAKLWCEPSWFPFIKPARKGEKG